MNIKANNTNLLINVENVELHSDINVANVELIHFDWASEKPQSSSLPFCAVQVTWSTGCSSGSAGVACSALWDFVAMILAQEC